MVNFQTVYDKNINNPFSLVSIAKLIATISFHFLTCTILMKNSNVSTYQSFLKVDLPSSECFSWTLHYLKTYNNFKVLIHWLPSNLTLNPYFYSIIEFKISSKFINPTRRVAKEPKLLHGLRNHKYN